LIGSAAFWINRPGSVRVVGDRSDDRARDRIRAR